MEGLRAGLHRSARSATKGWKGKCKFEQPGLQVRKLELSARIHQIRNRRRRRRHRHHPHHATTPTTPTTTTPTTPTTPSEPSHGSPLEGGSRRSSSPPVSADRRAWLRQGVPGRRGGRLEVGLFARGASPAKAGHSAQVLVGRLVRTSLSCRHVSFSVPLNAKGKAALRRHRRLTLTVKITLTPHTARR